MTWKLVQTFFCLELASISPPGCFVAAWIMYLLLLIQPFVKKMALGQFVKHTSSYADKLYGWVVFVYPWERKLLSPICYWLNSKLKQFLLNSHSLSWLLLYKQTRLIVVISDYFILLWLFCMCLMVSWIKSLISHETILPG